MLPIRIFCQFSQELADKIEALADHDRTTRPAIIRRIVGWYFDGLKHKDEGEN